MWWRSFLLTLLQPKVLKSDPELTDRYRTMSSDELVRLAADRESLTIDAWERLMDELKKRGLGSSDAIRQYEIEHRQQIERVDQRAAVGRLPSRLRIGRVMDPLKQYPLWASLISISFPPVGYEAFHALRIGSHILLSLLFVAAAFGAKSGLIAARSSSSVPVRLLGVIGTVINVSLALMFLVFAMFGVG